MYELNAGLPPEWPVLALIFAVTVAVMLFGMAVVTMFRYERKRTDAPVPRVFGPLTPALAKLLPLPASSRAGTRKDLMRAGYFEPVAEENFSAIRAVITFLPLLACEAMAVMLDGRIAVAFFVVGLIAGAAGFIVSAHHSQLARRPANGTDSPWAADIHGHTGAEPIGRRQLAVRDSGDGGRD